MKFDFFIGSSWDGSAALYGPDESAFDRDERRNRYTSGGCHILELLSVDLRRSLAADLSNATPLRGLVGTTFPVQTGAAAGVDSSGNYGLDYAIYYFGHGAGPILTFTAGASVATLTFECKPIASGDSPEEYWALDNLNVADAGATIPEPASIALLGAGLLTLGLLRRRS